MQHNYNTLFLNYNRSKNKFECDEIEKNQNLVPNSLPILKKFLQDLNKNKFPCILKYWYFSFIFLILYFIFFFICIFSIGFQYIFIAFIFFLLFIIVMITNAVFNSQWYTKIYRLKENYENKLINFYRMEKTHYFYFRRRRRYQTPLKIKLFPVINGQVLNLNMNPMMGMNPTIYNNHHQIMYNNQMAFNQNQNGFINNQTPNGFINNQNRVFNQNGLNNQNGIVNNQNRVFNQNGLNNQNRVFNQNGLNNQNRIVNNNINGNYQNQNRIIINNGNRIPFNNVKFHQVSPLPDNDDDEVKLQVKKEPAKKFY